MSEVDLSSAIVFTDPPDLHTYVTETVCVISDGFIVCLNLFLLFLIGNLLLMNSAMFG